MPSDRNHLHLGHDCVVPQFCSFNVAKYSCTNYSCIRLTNHAAYEERKTTPSRDVMSTLRMKKGRQHIRETLCLSAVLLAVLAFSCWEEDELTCSIDMSSIFLQKNCIMLLENALNDAPDSPIASDDRSSVRDDPSQVMDFNDLDHLLLS